MKKVLQVNCRIHHKQTNNSQNFTTTTVKEKYSNKLSLNELSSFTNKSGSFWLTRLENNSNFVFHSEWNTKQLEKLPTEFWNNFNNQRNYLDWLKNQVGILKPEDWYKITKDKIIEASF